MGRTLLPALHIPLHYKEPPSQQLAAFLTLGDAQNYLFILKRMLWLCSRMAIRDFTSYSTGFLKLIPSGKPATASEPGSFRNLSYGKGTTLLFPTASPEEGTTLHTDGYPCAPNHS